ncbi:hypothetical protein ACQP00_37650 [Dactylosporangium sp. CS-047395]|uniref:hypothetical protein n=1 Tax=Dactylosporangium sp. CS-047395 TaxID=3239936 RepID=UPI003D8A804C
MFDHKPLDASLEIKAKVTIVVRNSLLEQSHHDGPLASGIIAVTEQVAGPLSHFLAARRREPVDYRGPNPFAGLSTRYPHAWACLGALTEFSDGGRHPLRLPAASIPELPTDAELFITSPSEDGSTVVFSAIDPGFDEHLLDLLRQAADGDLVLCTSALSRYSRNSEKLHRVLEYLLVRDATILTTNHMIRPADVWVRRGDLVKPNSSDPFTRIGQTRGLVGAHRRTAETISAQHSGS